MYNVIFSPLEKNMATLTLLAMSFAYAVVLTAIALFIRMCFGFKSRPFLSVVLEATAAMLIIVNFNNQEMVRIARQEIPVIIRVVIYLGIAVITTVMFWRFISSPAQPKAHTTLK